jgi:hypothetical protein
MGFAPVKQTLGPMFNAKGEETAQACAKACLQKLGVPTSPQPAAALGMLLRGQNETSKADQCGNQGQP